MFERVKLPYEYADLEPHIDKLTVETHYEKHHKTYTDNFNEAIKKAPEFAEKPAEIILMNLDKAPEAARKALRNNGGGFYNHNLYFESMTPGGKKPSAKFEEIVKRDFGDFDSMLKKLHAAATADLFGSGWAWLIAKNGKLSIVISPNQDLPKEIDTPRQLLLPVDMWEHAFYLKYKNLKKDYVDGYFKVVNWAMVEARLNNEHKTV